PKTSGLLPCTSAPDKGGSNVAAKAPIAEKITKPAAAEARRKRQALLSDGPGALMAHPRPASWQWPWNSANAQATASPPHNWAQASRLFPPPPAPARVSSGPNRFSPAWYGLPPSRESPTTLAIPSPPPPSCLRRARFLPRRDPPRHCPAPPQAQREILSRPPPHARR